MSQRTVGFKATGWLQIGESVCRMKPSHGRDAMKSVWLLPRRASSSSFLPASLFQCTSRCPWTNRRTRSCRPAALILLDQGDCKEVRHIQPWKLPESSGKARIPGLFLVLTSTCFLPMSADSASVRQTLSRGLSIEWPRIASVETRAGLQPSDPARPALPWPFLSDVRRKRRRLRAKNGSLDPLVIWNLVFTLLPWRWRQQVPPKY
jgi:hypothetical protein